MFDDVFTLLGIAVLFLLLGIGAFIWDRKESKGYYNSIAGRADAREFLDRWPPRAEFGALKIGGWISITIAVILLIIGAVVWFRG